jgi:hypothetical protein
MRGWSRAGSTLLGAGVAGFLLWLAAQWSHGSTGGYWAAYGVVAGAGLVLGISQLRGRDGHPGATIGLAFIPVLIVAGWVLLGAQPHPNWFRNHVLAWSGDIHVRGIVHDLATWLGVLAFGIGAVLGIALEPRTMRRRREEAVVPPAATRATPAPATTTAPASSAPVGTMAPVASEAPVRQETHDPRAADEPLAAERREVTADGAMDREMVGAARRRRRIGWH